MGIFDKMFGRGADNAPAGSEQKFNQLKQKYQTVLNTIEQQNVRLQNLHIEGDKLYIKGTAPSQQAKDAIWNQIKLVDPSYADLTCDLTVEESQAPAAPAVRSYTVKAGDSLWKIAQQFYGNGSQYPKIIAGNAGQLKDEKTVIHPGDVLAIPE